VAHLNRRVPRIATTTKRVAAVRRSSSSLVIKARHLKKRYAGSIDAVKDLSLGVHSGEIVAVVGPNGAGKSTALNMLATLVRPTSGNAWICGIPVTERAEIRPRVGVALQYAGLDPLMTVRRHFEVHSALYMIPRAKAESRTSDLADAFKLTTHMDRRAGVLSGGTQRRVSLALALIHEPDAIIFDEPTVGLDPNSRRDVWDLLTRLRAN
jgi:ABC-2 type transport system ATP-binding protein